MVQNKDFIINSEKKGLPKKYISVTLLVTILFLASLLLIVGGYNHIKQTRTKLLATEASKNAEQGNFEGAAKKQAEAFKNETSITGKARAAYSTGLYYYYANNLDEAQKWLELSNAKYKSINDSQQAKAAQQLLDRFQSLDKKDKALSEDQKIGL